MSTVNEPVAKDVLTSDQAATVNQLLQGVVQYGTGTAAALPGWQVAGKTGTTENYGDAWFVGWNERMTVAIWVGYPDRLEPMLTQYGGQPVAGGTYPALLWHNFILQAMAILEQRAATAEALRAGEDPSTVQTTTTPGVESAPASGGSSTTGTGTTDGGTDGGNVPDAGGTGDTGGGNTPAPPAGGGTVTPPAGGDGGGTGTPTPPAGGGANGGGAAPPSG